jgi:hypothetical protein
MYALKADSTISVILTNSSGNLQEKALPITAMN